MPVFAEVDRLMHEIGRRPGWPSEVIVHADKSRMRPAEGKAKEASICWSEFRSDDLYRRIEMLHVTAPKAHSVVTRISIATAA